MSNLNNNHNLVNSRPKKDNNNKENNKKGNKTLKDKNGCNYLNLNDNLKMIHWNCNSINNKIEEFKEFCLNTNRILYH
jgi:hypothetical protein